MKIFLFFFADSNTLESPTTPYLGLLATTIKLGRRQPTVIEWYVPTG